MERNVTKPVPRVQLEKESRNNIQRAVEFESEIEEEEGAVYNGRIEDVEVEDGGNALGGTIFLGESDTESLPVI